MQVGTKHEICRVISIKHKYVTLKHKVCKQSYKHKLCTSTQFLRLVNNLGKSINILYQHDELLINLLQHGTNINKDFSDDVNERQKEIESGGRYRPIGILEAKRVREKIMLKTEGRRIMRLGKEGKRRKVLQNLRLKRLTQKVS